MSDYIPSLAQVRRSYDGQWDVASPHGPEAASEFDRWLAEHDRRIAEAAWEQGRIAGGGKQPGHWENDNPRPGLRTFIVDPNPFAAPNGADT